MPKTGTTLDQFDMKLEQLIEAIDALETQTFQNLSGWTTKPGTEATQVPSIQTNLCVKMPLVEPVVDYANSQDAPLKGPPLLH